MDIISVVATSIALGAAAGLKDTASNVVKDSYAALKNFLRRKLPSVLPSVAQLEQAPESKARLAVVEEELNKTGAANDTELLNRARELLELIEKQAPGVATVIGVSLKDILAASLSIENVVSTEAGVEVKNAKISGDISIKDVRAGKGDSDSLKKG
jgi:hypothetical protein